MDRTLPLAVAIALLMIVLPSGIGWAADFKIENRVFVEKEEQPVSQSVTIFRRGIVYDFLDDPAEVTIFDPANARFILLDVDRKLRTDLSPTVVRQTLDRLKKMAEKSEVPQTQFLYHPKFEITVDDETDEVVFDSKWLAYRVKGTRPDNADVVRQYREFSDWYARLNTFLRPNSRPPYARLVVNEQLAKRGEIPKEIVLVLRRRRGLMSYEDKLHAEYRFAHRLVESDQRRVATAGKQMAEFKTVSFREYETRIEADTGDKSPKSDKGEPKPHD